MVPAGQGMQMLAPVNEVYLPAAQFVQLSWPANANWPVLQNAQLIVLVGYMPLKQPEHAPAPVPDMVPGPQFKHVAGPVAPVSEE